MVTGNVCALKDTREITVNMVRDVDYSLIDSGKIERSRFTLHLQYYSPSPIDLVL